MEQNFEQTLEQLKANQLTKLDLSYKKLTEVQVIRLAEALKYNQSLTALNLSYNQLGVAGASMLSEALKVNRTLTTLGLCFNQLGAAGAEKISEALRVNQTLIILDLYDNQLGVAGASMLSEALKVNRTLTTLYLHYNQLGDAGAEKLSEALKVNQTLTTLELGNNELNKATVQVIKAALQTNIERIKSTRNQTFLTLIILLKHAHSPQSSLPFELWEIILRQLDFPSLNKGYRTSHTLVDYLTQKNTWVEFNQRLQSKQSVCLKETHGAHRSKSGFSFLTPSTTLLPAAANPISQVSHKDAEPQLSFLPPNNG